VMLGSIAYGALIEVLQLVTSYRHGQLSDILVDAIGVLIGLLVVRLIGLARATLSPKQHSD
jgi:VanZ family protein